MRLIFINTNSIPHFIDQEHVFFFGGKHVEIKDLRSLVEMRNYSLSPFNSVDRMGFRILHTISGRRKEKLRGGVFGKFIYKDKHNFLKLFRQLVNV